MPTLFEDLTSSEHLFSVRLWCEEQSENQGEWRGQITNLHNQEVRYFRDPATLYGVLLKMVDRQQQHEEDTPS